jgi:hypothetical protein
MGGFGSEVSKCAYPTNSTRYAHHFIKILARSSRDEAMRFAITSDERRANVVKHLLDELLSGRYTAAEMKGVLRRSPADVGF